jgi:hypothetical protein
VLKEKKLALAAELALGQREKLKRVRPKLYSAVD